jgi:hypothetical protein
MLFKEIIAVYSENHNKSTKTEYKVVDYWRRWNVYLPLGFKRLKRALMRILQPNREAGSNCTVRALYQIALAWSYQEE